MSTTIRGPVSSTAIDRDTVRDALRRALRAPCEHNAPPRLAPPWFWTPALRAAPRRLLDAVGHETPVKDTSR